MSKESKNEKHWYKNPAIIAPITVALIGAIAMIVTPIIRDLVNESRTPSQPLSDTRPEVNITTPVDNSIVSGDSIQIEGYLSKELGKGQFLYTVIEAQEPLWWPEQAILTYSQKGDRYEFSCTHWIEETGEGKETLKIKVIMVDLAIHDRFQKWRSNCIAADDWPGIPISNVTKWGELETCASVTIIH